MIYVFLINITGLVFLLKICKSNFIFLIQSYLIYLIIITSFSLGLIIEKISGFPIDIPSNLYSLDLLDYRFFVTNILIQLLFYLFSRKSQKYNLVTLKNISERSIESYHIFTISIVTLFGFLGKNSEIFNYKLLDFMFNLTYFFPFYIGYNFNKIKKIKYFYLAVLMVMLIVGIKTGSRGVFLYHFVFIFLGVFLNNFSINKLGTYLNLVALLIILVISGYLQMARYDQYDLVNFIINDNQLLIVAIQHTLSRITSYSSIIALGFLDLFNEYDLNGILNDIIFFLTPPNLDYEDLVRYVVAEKVGYGIATNLGLSVGPGIVPPVPIFAEGIYRGGITWLILLLALYLFIVKKTEILINKLNVGINKNSKIFLLLMLSSLFTVKFHEWSIFYIIKSIPIYLIGALIIIKISEYLNYLINPQDLEGN